MPKGPRGEKRPADVVGNAVLIGRIAVGEAQDSRPDPAKAYRSTAGKKGGPARAAKLTPEQRSEIAKKAAAKRWSK